MLEPTANIEAMIDDVHAAAGVLKLFFRELPDPLFPRSGYRQIIDAVKIEDPRLRLIQIHEHVNGLPDSNYATLRFLTFHLSK